MSNIRSFPINLISIIRLISLGKETKRKSNSKVSIYIYIYISFQKRKYIACVYFDLNTGACARRRYRLIGPCLTQSGVHSPSIKIGNLSEAIDNRAIISRETEIPRHEADIRRRYHRPEISPTHFSQ